MILQSKHPTGSPEPTATSGTSISQASAPGTHSPPANKDLPVSVQYSRFVGTDGVEEIQWIIRPTCYAHFETQLAWVEEAYLQALSKAGLSPDSAVWRRFLCSDLMNQASSLRKRAFSNPEHPETDCAISWVGQIPAPPSKLTLWAQHIHEPGRKLAKTKQPQGLSLKRGALTHHWTTGMHANTQADSHSQTLDIFGQYQKTLGQQQMTLAEHLVRTWFFVQNVDSNYTGLVNARNQIFDRSGLTPETHFIASTGIEGCHTSPDTKVLLDAYAVAGLHPEQVTYLHALEHLSPTHVYGVAFERATSVAYRDRQHIFISGTASIDHQGNTLHLNQIDQQLERTLVNIEALLNEADASSDDLQIMLVYLRDPNDAEFVRHRLDQKFSSTPYEILTAPVCRPGWLIEIEGLAITQANHPDLPRF